jgi:NADPH-dependent 2,4-dienoyl-CoA reductase/sulfur reductase-like enzyme
MGTVETMSKKADTCRISCDVAIIGAGPSGLAAAIAAKEAGANRVVLVERDFRPGGILQQCIHTGFGLKYFGEELTGPEYAHRFIEKSAGCGVTLFLNTMVLSIDSENKLIHAVNPDGCIEIQADSIILAMGCRERTRSAIAIPGTRPAGIYTAGVAQRFINIQNEMIGKKVVILGSGDIGMIMARRLTFENVKVEAVLEAMPYLTGLTRNRVQCLDDFGIPLFLNHTIIDIKGGLRVEGVTVAEVDERMQPIHGTEFDIACDTVLLSIGLIPENELSKSCGVVLDPITGGPIVDNNMQTNVPGIFACGNVVHVNDLVDNVSTESEIAGAAAAGFAKGTSPVAKDFIDIVAGNGVRYTVPQQLDRATLADNKIKVYFRVENPASNVGLCLSCDDERIGFNRRQIVSPGEIDTLEIDGNEVIKNGGNQVIVSVDESERI